MVVALLVLLVVYGIAPGIGLLSLPFAVLIMYATSVGVSMLFAATSVQYRDMDILVPLITQAWFWVSPIIYPTMLIPADVRTFYYLNPLAVCHRFGQVGLHADASPAARGMVPRGVSRDHPARGGLRVLPSTGAALRRLDGRVT